MATKSIRVAQNSERKVSRGKCGYIPGYKYQLNHVSDGVLCHLLLGLYLGQDCGTSSALSDLKSLEVKHQRSPVMG